MTERYDNSGAIFINDKKEREGHPDRTGQATIDGVDYWVSGWIKKGGIRSSRAASCSAMPSAE